MKPKCKNDRFNQQHKIYEQGRRSVIVQLISSLHSCLPREYKPKKDNQKDILSSVLDYVKFLQRRNDRVDVSIVPDEIDRELEKLKTYTADLEERCNRYAKQIDANKESEKLRQGGQNSQTLPGSVSVIAASAPLVFLVSQQTTLGKKDFTNASTSTDPDSSRSYLESSTTTGNVKIDASTSMEAVILVERAIGTDETVFATVGIQTNVGDAVDRGCSPVTFVQSTAAATSVSGDDQARKRQSTMAGSTDVAEAAANDKNKRRRSDESTQSISEIVNLVASNELGTHVVSAGANGKQSDSRTNDRNESTGTLLSVTSLLQQQQRQQRPPNEHVQDQGHRGSSSGQIGSSSRQAAPQTTASQLITPQTTSAAIVLSSWVNSSTLEPCQQALNRSSSQSRQIQQPSQQHRPQTQVQQPPTRDNRQQPSGSAMYQGSSASEAIQSYASASASESQANVRRNENCSKNSSASRRGVNFSVEFLHGGGGGEASGNVGEQIQQQDLSSNHPRQTEHRSRPQFTSTTDQSYQLNGQALAASSVAQTGYYNFRHGSTAYVNSGTNWAPSSSTWTSDPAYQWWTGPNSSSCFPQSSSTNASKQQPNSNASNAGKNGASSSSGGNKSTSSGHSSSRTTHDDPSVCINLSNSNYDHGNLLFPSSTAVITSSTTAALDSWSTPSSGGYTATNRFGYCAAPTLFDPSFNYMRNDIPSTSTSSARKSALATATTTVPSVVTAPVVSNTYSSNYWTSDWTFPTSSSTSNFSLHDHSSQQQHHHQKAQNFQIATMFPEASSSGSSWRLSSSTTGGGYRHQDDGQQVVNFGNTRGAISSTSGYTMHTPTYRQVSAESSCNLPEFS